MTQILNKQLWNCLGLWKFVWSVCITSLVVFERYSTETLKYWLAMPPGDGGADEKNCKFEIHLLGVDYIAN